MNELPDKMTGKDLVAQEVHESNIEKHLFDKMDYIERRDRQEHIQSRSFSRRGKQNFDNIKWNNLNRGAA